MIQWNLDRSNVCFVVWVFFCFSIFCKGEDGIAAKVSAGKRAHAPKGRTVLS